MPSRATARPRGHKCCIFARVWVAVSALEFEVAVWGRFVRKGLGDGKRRITVSHQHFDSDTGAGLRVVDAMRWALMTDGR